jgi:alanine racemase
MSIRKSIDTFLKQFETEYVTNNLIEVSRSALLHNIALFERLSKKQVIPVLKGNAYGHGIEIVARALKGTPLTYVAVDSYFEALRIREVSNQPVLIMGAILPGNYAHMRYDNFSFVVSSKATIEALGNTREPIKVHLECNTGMNRNGAKPNEIEHLVQVIQRYKNLMLEGVMSHLADADGDSAQTVDAATTLFDNCVESVLNMGAQPTMFHIAQSAGSLRVASRYANFIRPGIGTYGINPFPYGHDLYEKLHRELQPALTLTSTISSIIELEKGDKVGYNYTFEAPKKMRIAILPIGYYEGFNRALSNKGVVKISSTFSPVVGRICMNVCMVSLDNTDATIGDRVVIYSNKPSDKNSIDTISKEDGLFNYELLSALSQDVRRTLVA